MRDAQSVDMAITPAAAWMDRLSDRIGGMVPGGSRMPARHPIKVSLVMGVLGLIAGWLTTAAFYVLRDFSTSRPAQLISFVPGTVLGLCVLLPLMFWQGLPGARCTLGVLLSFLAGWMHLAIIGREPPEVSACAFAGLLSGFAYAWAGAASSRKNIWWMILPVPLASAALHAALIVCIDPQYGSIRWLPNWVHESAQIMFAANLFAGIFACVGITFSHSLWDTTPRPKFEPCESARTDGA
jgi:hypothetical protein